MELSHSGTELRFELSFSTIEATLMHNFQQIQQSMTDQQVQLNSLQQTINSLNGSGSVQEPQPESDRIPTENIE